MDNVIRDSASAFETARPPRALTIKEFCYKYRISGCTFYKWIKTGRGPQVVRFGKNGAGVRITPEAEQEWLERERTRVESEASELEKARRRAHAQYAARRSLESPRHPANARRRQQRG